MLPVITGRNAAESHNRKSVAMTAPAQPKVAVLYGYGIVAYGGAVCACIFYVRRDKVFSVGLFFRFSVGYLPAVVGIEI